VRYFGLSNFRAWRVADIVRLADQLGIASIDRPVALEPVYNVVDRTAEVELMPAAGHYGIGVVPYSPLARGMLSGKYALDGTPPADSRVGRGDKRIQQTEWRPESLAIAQKVAAHAAERGTTSIAFAIAWV
jgi:aryl-alcohol dehydrogenase-like predicted oxidoreductase